MSYFTFFMFSKSSKPGMCFTLGAHLHSDCSHFKCLGAFCWLTWDRAGLSAPAVGPLPASPAPLCLSVGHTLQVLFSASSGQGVGEDVAEAGEPSPWEGEWGNSPTPTCLHSHFLCFRAFRQPKNEALLCYWGFPSLAHLRLYQVTQMVLEKVKGIK